MSEWAGGWAGERMGVRVGRRASVPSTRPQLVGRSRVRSHSIKDIFSSSPTAMYRKNLDQSRGGRPGRWVGGWVRPVGRRCWKHANERTDGRTPRRARRQCRDLMNDNSSHRQPIRPPTLPPATAVHGQEETRILKEAIDGTQVGRSVCRPTTRSSGLPTSMLSS